MDLFKSKYIDTFEWSTKNAIHWNTEIYFLVIISSIFQSYNIKNGRRVFFKQPPNAESSFSRWLGLRRLTIRELLALWARSRAFWGSSLKSCCWRTWGSRRVFCYGKGQSLWFSEYWSGGVLPYQLGGSNREEYQEPIKKGQKDQKISEEKTYKKAK